jgi:hypothetical protein
MLLVIRVVVEDRPRQQFGDEKTSERYDRHKNSTSPPDNHIDMGLAFMATTCQTKIP